jgi:hypothetical protein
MTSAVCVPTLFVTNSVRYAELDYHRLPQSLTYRGTAACCCGRDDGARAMTRPAAGLFEPTFQLIGFRIR